MGLFRFISKPIKRYLFNYANIISNKWYLIVLNKYKQKYINKLYKIGLNNTFDPNPGLDLFLHNLEINLEHEKSLAHSKVREYWLRRGPRLIIFLLITSLITIGLSQWLITVTINDHIITILIGINIILYNMYMLYQRLIDAISGAMMRIGHVHYSKWKSNIFLY